MFQALVVPLIESPPKLSDKVGLRRVGHIERAIINGKFLNGSADIRQHVAAEQLEGVL